MTDDPYAQLRNLKPGDPIPRTPMHPLRELDQELEAEWTELWTGRLTALIEGRLEDAERTDRERFLFQSLLAPKGHHNGR